MPSANLAGTTLYATAIGEQRDQLLTDGTRLLLDTDSAVDIRFDSRERLVEVRRGRVQIEVGKDARPFLVRAGQAVVRDIGTTFQVSRGRGEAVQVGLIEGMVQVSLGNGADTIPDGNPGAR